MKDRQSTHQPRLICAQATRGGCVTAFTVCLFIVIFAVFAWVIHRRLAQYDTILPTLHQSTATKVCLTERTQIPLPSTHGIDGFTMLFEILVVTATLFALSNSEASLHLRVLHNRRNGPYPPRSRPGLVHFFSLPPPSLSSSL